MKALSGTMAERARAVLSAGSDVALVCSGDLADTEAVAAVVPPLRGASLQRFERAHAVFGQQQPFDEAEAKACLAQALRAIA
jgi:beta-N-acetylhexosaminidase